MATRKILYTIGYTIFQNENGFNLEYMFNYLKEHNVSYLVDVRSVPFSKQYPQCNADNMKVAGKIYGVPYIHMPELGAKADASQNVFSKASDIFFDDIFPIAKSNRPEKTELVATDEIVDFNKFRNSEYFKDGLKRIEKAYDNNYTLCLMCSESNPMDCHRYFLISKTIELKFGDWLEIEHIIKNDNGEFTTISNKKVNDLFIKNILNKDIVKKLDILSIPLFGTSCLDNYFGDTQEDKICDFCDRYWNLIHGWKKYNDINIIEDYD